MVGKPPRRRLRGAHNPTRRTPSRRALGTQEGDRRQRHRPASTARRIFFASCEMHTPLRGVGPPTGSQPLVGRSRARPATAGGVRGCAPPDHSQAESAAALRPGSPEGSGPRLSSGQPQQGREGGSASAGSAPGAPPGATAALLERFTELFGAPDRFSHRRWGARLDQALSRLDRYADFGRGREGAGLDFAFGLMEACAEALRWESRRREPPGSLAYFVPVLEEVSKKWRRDQARRASEAPAGWRGSWANPKQKAGARLGRPRAGKHDNNNGR
jgi:hypothetical protein